MNFPEFKDKFQKKKVEEVENLVIKAPLVSILVQTYNHGEFISSCLNSILNQQTNFEFEILIGEDDSQDNTREICQTYAINYPKKIRLLLHHRENQIKILGGATSNFNALYNFYSSNGKYIAFCEGDDMWTDPFKLQKQIVFLEGNHEYSFVYHSYFSINSKGKKINTPEANGQPKIDLSTRDLLEAKYHPLLLCVSFKKEFLELPKEMCEVLNLDTFLYSYLGLFGRAKFMSDINPSLYRNHEGGTWSQRNKEKKYLSKLHTYQQLRDFYIRINKAPIANHYIKIIKNTRKTLIIINLKNLKFLNGFKILRKLL